jgi:hypothetical protein
VAAFIIAFVLCQPEECIIAYPRAGQLYPSFAECSASLPAARRVRDASIECLEVPASLLPVDVAKR